MKYTTGLFIALSFLWLGCNSVAQDVSDVPKLKALIIDGENNHGVWPKTTMMMKDFLEQTGLFEVDIERTAYTWQGPHYDKSIGLDDIKTLLTMYPLASGKKTEAVDEPRPDPDYSPDFKKYDVVISNMGWKASTWTEATKRNFEQYMAEGGGLVVVHAANNSWGDWTEYNKMIGLGGWGGRNEESGYYVHYNDNGRLLLEEPEGECGSHGAQHEYILKTQAPEHPIMKGLPAQWIHAKDELYDRMCGPAENMTVLATAYSDEEKNGPPWNKEVKGTGMHEPLLFTIDYGKGRVFQTGLGHMGYSMECVGFMTTFQRGAEWVATGKVTQKVPEDFPGTEKVSVRKWKK
ncbi:MAG: ThuA domain-containing protein [Cyclobacteriaceae bacterium]|nr:ThuA domain-containing protein [Cyclobacteriaceae bacterium]